jgi:hypothetical protein
LLFRPILSHAEHVILRNAAGNDQAREGGTAQIG